MSFLMGIEGAVGCASNQLEIAKWKMTNDKWKMTNGNPTTHHAAYCLLPTPFVSLSFGLVSLHACGGAYEPACEEVTRGEAQNHAHTG